MAQTNSNLRPLHFADDDEKFDFLARKAKKKYKGQVRKHRMEAESATGELNLTAMMDMMTILLVFLIKSFGAADINVAMGEDLMPPTSTSMLTPSPAITLTITRKDIAVGEKGAVPLVNGGTALAPDQLDGNLIPRVKDRLDAEIEKLRKIAEFNKSIRDKAGTDKDPMKMLIVVGDKNMPYDLLLKALYTAGQSGMKYFKFLTLGTG